MKQKFISIIILIVIILLSFSSMVLASTKADKLAYIIYDNIADLNNLLPLATNTYNQKGYITTIHQPLPASLLFSNYVANNVQLYFAHGGYADATDIKSNKTYTNESFILFPSKYSALTTAPSGTYKVFDPKNNNKYIGRFEACSINDIDVSNVRLITLGVCKSAGNGNIQFNSLAAKMWMNGADMIVGWYSDVTTPSLVNWLEHYHTALSNGYTVSNAMQYANNQLYVFGSGVHECHLYANNAGALSTDELEALNIKTSGKIKKNNFNLDNINNRNVDNVENIIRLNDSNFDENNYKKEIVQGMSMCNSDGVIRHVSSYINYYLKIGDYVTNSGYTVSLDENGNIQNITNNTLPQVTSKMQNILINDNLKTHNTNEANLQKYIEQAKINIADITTIKNEDAFYFYDLIENKKYVCIELTLSDSSTMVYTYDI